MFTTKYRSFVPAAMQDGAPGAPTLYDTCEQLSGPYEFISQEMEDGHMVVHGHREGGAPGYTWGPFTQNDVSEGRPARPPAPRPTLYVMNESGATVAKYDL